MPVGNWRRSKPPAMQFAWTQPGLKSQRSSAASCSWRIGASASGERINLNRPKPSTHMSESFAQLFEQSLASQRIKPGTILMGHVIEVSDDFVVVNVGLKSEAVISIDQFKSEKGEIEVKAGDDV